MPRFGKKSRSVKKTINPFLGILCDLVVKHFDIALLEGRRDEVRQNELYGSGLSQVEWPNSKHNALPTDEFPDNLSKAVDVAPWPIPEGWGNLKGQTPIARDLEWKERVKFYEMAAVFRYCWGIVKDKYAGAARYELRLGCDWDGDHDYKDQTFDDLVHVELVENGHV